MAELNLIGDTSAGDTRPPAPPGVPGAASTLPVHDAPPQPTAPEGRPEYVPEQFWRRSEADPTKGEAHLEAWGKSWHDTRATLTKTQQELAALRQQASLPSAPQNAADYYTGYDFAALEQAAPRAFKGGGTDNVTIQVLQAAALKHGLSVEQLRGVTTDLFAGLNEHVPEAVEPQAAIAEQVKTLGTEGPRLADEVSKAMETLHAESAFDESQQALMKDILASPGGIGLMHRMLRSGGSIAPPTIEPRSAERMTQYEIQQAMVSPRYRSDDAYRRKVMDAHAALQAERKHDVEGMGVHRSLRMG